MINASRNKVGEMRHRRKNRPLRSHPGMVTRGMGRQREKATYRIHQVERALDLLENIGRYPGELGVVEVCVKLGFSKEQAMKLLSSLERRGYIQRDGTDRYRLGLKAFEAGMTFFHQRRLWKEAESVLEELRDRSGETAYLAIRDGQQVIFLLVQESPQPVRAKVKLGQSLPAHANAAGKALLAFLSNEELERTFREQALKPLTKKTLSRLDLLKAHLQGIIRSGYAVENEEMEEGLKGVAAPVRDATGRVVAAVGLLGPAYRLPDERIKGELKLLILEMAFAISQRLGYLEALTIQ